LASEVISMRPYRYEVIPMDEVPPGEVCIGAASLPLVLVVDDEPSDSLALILRKKGFDTRSAYSGAGALTLSRERPPAFLITDVCMPGMNGVELAKTVMDRFPLCKVTLFSGHATQHELAEARSGGYDLPLLTKPVHPEQIVAHIRERLNIGNSLWQDHDRVAPVAEVISN